MVATQFSEKLVLILKLLSLTGGKLAAQLGVDKSVVSRWLNGGANPSAHNLSAITALVAVRVPEFRTLDWDRDLVSLAELCGVDASVITPKAPRMAGLPLANLEQMIHATETRGKAFEGFFRSTRPHPMVTGRFVHEQGMIRRDAMGLLRLRAGSANGIVEGWMLPIHGSLCSVAVDLNSGTLVFGIFHAVGAARVDVFDGLALMPGADMGRSPIAVPMISERIGELSDNAAADDARLDVLMTANPIAPEGSIDAAMQAHLAGDFGPRAAASGGDWLLCMSLARTLARGPKFDLSR